VRLLLYIMALLENIFHRLTQRYNKSIKKRSNVSEKLEHSGYARNRKKPQWVVDKVIYLKAMMPDNGCGSIANIFNRIHHDQNESVSKTYVYEKLKANSYQIKCKRREIKSRKPKASAINHTWGIDLTTANINGKQRLILGIIDHGSRALLCLQELKSKHSLVILRELIQTIKHYGFPKKIRTDNESCFTSKLIKLSLRLLSIKRQTTDIACPWQNGRIERCFGTFKQKWRQISFVPYCHLQAQLNIYQVWYNVIRPHSNLESMTPAEVFNNKQHRGTAKFVNAWDGVLSGFYFPD